MSDLIDAVIQTRKTAAEIFAKSLADIAGNSEVEVANKILAETKNHSQIFEAGWYDPPPSGIAVIFDQKPFKRLQYDSLRKPEYWPKQTFKFEPETVGMVYSSAVDRATGMLGDIGLSVYLGKDKKIKDHIRETYASILGIAEYVQVGMKFSELCSFARNSFQNKYKFTRWVVRSKPNHSINLGHTVPGSFEDLTFGDDFEQVKETIPAKRIFIMETENFQIPETCAFTIESRLENLNKPELPSVYFHFIVCFNKGEKQILENFSQIFNVMGMDYMKG